MLSFSLSDEEEEEEGPAGFLLFSCSASESELSEEDEEEEDDDEEEEEPELPLLVPFLSTAVSVTAAFPFTVPSSWDGGERAGRP